jgi:hypothetical protein
MVPSSTTPKPMSANDCQLVEHAIRFLDRNAARRRAMPQ